jgi:hypothetical protein
MFGLSLAEEVRGVTPGGIGGWATTGGVGAGVTPGGIGGWVTSDGGMLVCIMMELLLVEDGLTAHGGVWRRRYNPL